MDQARLIAEAPAMLEALREFVACCSGERPHPARLDAAGNATWDTIMKARAILARIEGRE